MNATIMRITFSKIFTILLELNVMNMHQFNRKQRINVICSIKHTASRKCSLLVYKKMMSINGIWSCWLIRLLSDDLTVYIVYIRYINDEKKK